jgi:hypothetical protein
MLGYEGAPLTYVSEIHGVCCNKDLPEQTDERIQILIENSQNLELPPSSRARELEELWALRRERDQGPPVFYIVQGKDAGMGNTGAWRRISSGSGHKRRAKRRG